MKNLILNFAQTISHTLNLAMEKDPKVLCFGLGVTDPKEVFNTEGLLQKFGADRVFDVPCSENAITGIGIGASLRDLDL